MVLQEMVESQENETETFELYDNAPRGQSIGLQEDRILVQGCTNKCRLLYMDTMTSQFYVFIGPDEKNNFGKRKKTIKKLQYVKEM